MLKAFVSISLLCALSGCQALAEMAYDDRLGNDATRCNALTSQVDRQACRGRVTEIEKQAAEARKQR